MDPFDDDGLDDLFNKLDRLDELEPFLSKQFPDDGHQNYNKVWRDHIDQALQEVKHCLEIVADLVRGTQLNLFTMMELETIYNNQGYTTLVSQKVSSRQLRDNINNLTLRIIKQRKILEDISFEWSALRDMDHHLAVGSPIPKKMVMRQQLGLEIVGNMKKHTTVIRQLLEERTDIEEDLQQYWANMKNRKKRHVWWRDYGMVLAIFVVFTAVILYQYL